MLVYRIETEGGFGPYNAGSYDSCIRSVIYTDPRYHPMPSLTWICDSDLSYGFVSLDQARRWFVEPYLVEGDLYTVYSFFVERGFSLSVYEVPRDCVKSDFEQAAFYKDEAVLVERISIEEFMGVDIAA